MKSKTSLKMAPEKKPSDHAHWYSLLLCVITLLLFTLKPFQFIHPPRPWDFDFYPRDLFQNVILFLPLGILLRRFLPRSMVMVVIFTAIISTTVECLQLFTPHRFSNPYDIVCNTLGGFAGAWMADQVFGKQSKERTAEFIVILLLLCWVIGSGIKGEAVSRYALFPFSAIGAAILFRNGLMPKIKRWVAIIIWSGLSSAFLFYSIRMKAVFYLPIVLMVNVLFCCLPIDHRRALVGLLFLGSALVLISVALRLASPPWNWDISLRVMELLLLVDLYYLFRQMQSAESTAAPALSAAIQA